MSDILDKIDASLEEVEEQLLNAFNRLRADHQTGAVTVDDVVRQTLGEATERLYHDLEHSGSEKRLELRTDRHEVLLARLGVVRQLLKSAEFSVSDLHEAHEAIENSRRRLEKRVVARRRKLEDREDGDQKPPRRSLFKGLFGREAGEREVDRNRISVTEEEEYELQDVDVYLDGGIYSASRELAMLANLLERGATDKPPPDQPRGKAVFEARELSTTLPPANKTKPVTEEPAEPAQKEGKRDIAQTPEEIRRKLQERQYKSSGRASFVSRDIEPAHPQDFYGRKPDNQDEENEEKSGSEEERPRSGKAIFESRDLSRSPWEDKDK